MENIDKKTDVTALKAKDEVLLPNRVAGPPKRPSNPLDHLTPGKSPSCMPPSLSPTRVSTPDDAPLASSLPAIKGLDLLGESEEYTTEADGSRSLVERAERMAKIEMTLDAQYAVRVAKTTALEKAQEKYSDYLTATEETNQLIEKRKTTALRVLMISGALALALTITLFVLGGF